jgi:Protein of unknown function (DUF2530)
MTEPQALDIEPVADDGVGAVTAGLGLWLVAGIACLVQRDALADRGATWWVWTCLAGLVLGVVMLVYMRRRSAVYRAHRIGQSDADAPHRSGPDVG